MQSITVSASPPVFPQRAQVIFVKRSDIDRELAKVNPAHVIVKGSHCVHPAPPCLCSLQSIVLDSGKGGECSPQRRAAVDCSQV